MMSGDDVCCSVMFSTLFGVSVFSVVRPELLMTDAISFTLWSAVYECQGVEWCELTSQVRTECRMCVMSCMVCCMTVPTVFFSVWMCCLEKV